MNIHNLFCFFSLMLAVHVVNVCAMQAPEKEKLPVSIANIVAGSRPAILVPGEPQVQAPQQISTVYPPETTVDQKKCCSGESCTTGCFEVLMCGLICCCRPKESREWD